MTDTYVSALERLALASHHIDHLLAGERPGAPLTWKTFEAFEAWEERQAALAALRSHPEWQRRFGSGAGVTDQGEAVDEAGGDDD